MISDPVISVLQLLQAVRPTGDGKWSARCPAHDDQHASLSVGKGDDGRALLHCHAGCPLVSIVRRLGISLGDLFPEGARKARGTSGKKIVAAYDYVSAQGDLLFQSVRFEPKDFRQRRPDGAGGWVWNLDGITRVLYRLPELADATLVFVVEGEKDVDALWGLGVAATCNSGGAGKWRLTDDTPLHGRRVVVIPDKDEPGRAHAQSVARSLAGKAEVRILELPGDGKDAADWVKAGGTREQLIELVAGAVEAVVRSDGYRLGERDPETGAMVLSVDRTLPTAEAYIREFYSHHEGRLIHRYSNKVFVWNGSRYVEIEEASLSAPILRWLHEARRAVYNADSDSFELREFPANPRTVAAARDSILALAHLPSETINPSWISGDGFPPSETIACRSRLLHVPTMQTVAVTPRFWSTAGLDFDHDPGAPEPARWLQFLNDVLGDNHEAWELLQEWFGLCLTADTSQQKMLLIVGPKRGGKGTITRVLRHLVGTGNVDAPTVDALGGEFGLESLIGKSVAIVSDARFSGANIQGIVERLLCISGEDAININQKGVKARAAMRLPTRFVFTTNELPSLRDASGALASRFMILQLSRSFFGRENLNLLDELLDELPGILNWAIAGRLRLWARGRFVQPASSLAVVQDVEDLASPVKAWIRECCNVATGARAYVDDLFHSWRSWCESEGAFVGTKQMFCRNLRAACAGLEVHRGSTGLRFYSGIGINGQESNS